MKGTHLGEFQEIVLLTIMVLDDNAYGVTIKREINEKMDRSISRGALHTALTRLEDKGFISSERGETNPDRGGHPKRYYTVTNKGIEALREAKELREQLWNRIPQLRLQNPS